MKEEIIKAMENLKNAYLKMEEISHKETKVALEKQKAREELHLAREAVRAITFS